jgi:major membrane immunogen (membrane-anchored lipoprotein)
MGIQEIEQAIAGLPPQELARFRQWFEQFDAQGWDQQFETDVQSGKLDKIAEKALSEYRAGKAKEL